VLFLKLLYVCVSVRVHVCVRVYVCVRVTLICYAAKNLCTKGLNATPPDLLPHLSLTCRDLSGLWGLLGWVGGCLSFVRDLSGFIRVVEALGVIRSCGVVGL
jgi:hypothetical protein